MSDKLETTLDKIAATSAKTIQEAAELSIQPESSPKTPVNYRTRSMKNRNREYRRRLGDLDPV
jgi:hypothetical protein